MHYPHSFITTKDKLKKKHTKKNNQPQKNKKKNSLINTDLRR